jgi:hypothetical protein
MLALLESGRAADLSPDGEDGHNIVILIGQKWYRGTELRRVRKVLQGKAAPLPRCSAFKLRRKMVQFLFAASNNWRTGL